MALYLYPDTDKKYDLFEINYPKIQDETAKEIITKSYSGGFTYANPTLKGKTIIIKTYYNLEKILIMDIS